MWGCVCVALHWLAVTSRQILLIGLSTKLVCVCSFSTPRHSYLVRVDFINSSSYPWASWRIGICYQESVPLHKVSSVVDTLAWAEDILLPIWTRTGLTCTVLGTSSVWCMCPLPWIFHLGAGSIGCAFNNSRWFGVSYLDNLIRWSMDSYWELLLPHNWQCEDYDHLMLTVYDREQNYFNHQFPHASMMGSSSWFKGPCHTVLLHDSVL